MSLRRATVSSCSADHVCLLVLQVSPAVATSWMCSWNSRQLAALPWAELQELYQLGLGVGSCGWFWRRNCGKSLRQFQSQAPLPRRVIVHSMKGRHKFWLHHKLSILNFAACGQMRHQITPAPNAPNVSPSTQYRKRYVSPRLRSQQGILIKQLTHRCVLRRHKSCALPFKWQSPDWLLKHDPVPSQHTASPKICTTAG